MFRMLLSSGAELMSVDCDDIDNSASSTSTSSSAKQKSCHEMRFEMWCEAVERNIPPDSNAKKSLDPSRIAALCNRHASKYYLNIHQKSQDSIRKNLVFKEKDAFIHVLM